jgi:hypothetical protein
MSSARGSSKSRALACSDVLLVRGGARLSGGVGDALVRPNWVELERRADIGMGAARDLVLLDALLSLPAGVNVPVADLARDAVRVLRRAPEGVVAFDGSGHVERVMRLLCRPLVFEGVEVEFVGQGWRRALAGAAVFARVVGLSGCLRPMRSGWECASVRGRSAATRVGLARGCLGMTGLWRRCLRGVGR